MIDHVDFVLHSKHPPFEEINRLSVPKDHFTFAKTVFDMRQEGGKDYSFSVIAMAGVYHYIPCKIVKLLHFKATNFQQTEMQIH